MIKPATGWIFAFLAMMLGASPAMALNSYFNGADGFLAVYPASQSGRNASCNTCHVQGAGTDLNGYGKDWAMQHNAGASIRAAFLAIEGLNSDNDPTGSSNIVEINANAQPGWTPGPNNTRYDLFSLAVSATNQNPPAITGNVLDPAAATNRPPVLSPIGARSVNEGQALAFTATATDPDGNALTFSAGNLPTGASFSPAGAFSWTPTFAQAGNYNVTFTVTDNGSPAASDFEIVTITVGNVNRPPVLGAINPSQSASSGQPFSLIVSASDPDGDTVRFTGSNLPTGAVLTDNLNGTATLAWTPTPAQTGAFPNVTIAVTDNGSPAQTATAQFTITVVAGNRPPVLAPIGAKTVAVSQALAFTATATDPDGNALTFSAGNLPAGATLSPAGAFSWTPTASQTGSFSVTITVTDNGTPPQSDSETISITVGNANRPPVLSPIGAKSVNEGQALSFTASASDPDGNALTFSSSSLPLGATFTPAGVFSWTPSFTQGGNYSVGIQVSDGALTASEVITITVGNVNRPPVLSPNPIGNRTVTVGQSLTIAITASDPDGDTLAFANANLPAGATLTANGPGAATFSWTPTAAQVGSFPNVTVSVSDGSLSDAEIFTITVQSATPPPSGSVSIKEAQWDDGRLKIEGKASAGATVTIVDAVTGLSLGTAVANAKGEWSARLRLGSAPCRVLAKAGSASSAVVSVKNAPRSCTAGNDDDDDDDEDD